MNTVKSITINAYEFQQMFEPLIRRITREDLMKAIQNKPNILFLDEAMPLYKDLEEIYNRKNENSIELFTHNEVWND